MSFFFSLFKTCILQWQMGLRDLGGRTQTLEATVVVNVVFNNNPPQITNCPGAPQTLNEDTNIGSVAFTFSFQDNDGSSPFNTVSLSLIGDDASLQAFSLEATSNIANQRRLFLNRTLAFDNRASYTVSPSVYIWTNLK
jgi:hypothetical protein